MMAETSDVAIRHPRVDVCREEFNSFLMNNCNNYWGLPPVMWRESSEDYLVIRYVKA